jgi:FtsP/CotA-like multicopper oxidase with cupredoxin domain
VRTRRQFLKSAIATGAAVSVAPGWVLFRAGDRWALAAIAGGSLDPTAIPKYVRPLVIPPAMPQTTSPDSRGAARADYYEIAVRQFDQQILPEPLPPTTVWSYGSVNHPETFNYPAFTIEAQWRKPVRVKWVNDLVDADGGYLPHLLPVDQTLHWANPSGGEGGTDMRGTDPQPYLGPVPIVTHLHGSEGVGDESDGYAEAWYLPAADNIPVGYASGGTWYDFFKAKSEKTFGETWEPGTAVFQYPNSQRAATLWYHDHTLGMTRLNVYAGPAGFYLMRGGPGDLVIDGRSGGRASLPGPAPALGDPAAVKYYEIPLAIQDRSFNDDGSLFYPSTRAFFEGLEPGQLQIPFVPDEACDGEPSDVSPIWNPEFFGNTMVVNGRTWPYLEVEPRRYRFRILNGCNSRFLILAMDNGQAFWQIGADGGFLPEAIKLNQVLLGPAERADVIVDFTGLAVGSEIVLTNNAPDEPFGGGEPGVDFEPADPDSTGAVMKFVVVPSTGPDASTPPGDLRFPVVTPIGSPRVTRKLSLNEQDSATVRVLADEEGNWLTPVVLACDDLEAVPFGPTEARLGILDEDGNPVSKKWADPITEHPLIGRPELWELYNFTADAHPIHIHEIQFQVQDRQSLATDEEGMATSAGLVDHPRPPELWEAGFKDTVIAYPGEVTRLKAVFTISGLYVWHCHIVEHEDNEMMRPYFIGNTGGYPLDLVTAGL